jgi:transcriptional regulator with XRE-family HTH domain
MTYSELKLLLLDLELSQVEFAKLVGVTPRAVNMWVQGEREIPGPVESYLRIFRMLNSSQRFAEKERVAGKEKVMREGMYEIQFHTSGNPADWGMAVLIFGGGIVYGADAGGGASYDGTYAPTAEPGIVDVKLKVSFPPNVLSIFGISHPHEWSIEVRTKMDSRNEAGKVFAVTNLGQNVDASYSFIRALPEAA